MTEHINSWKNEKIFLDQLELNKLELVSGYPHHWVLFISLIKQIENKKNILDIGCGCGAIYELCRKEFPSLEYFGIDYSEDAVKIAKKEFCETCFDVLDVYDLTKDYIKNYDVCVMNGLLAILPNADEILENFLKLEPKNLIICRVDYTESKPYYEVYNAYGKIQTYKYFHNKHKLKEIIERYGYVSTDLDKNPNSILITKKI